MSASFPGSPVLPIDRDSRPESRNVREWWIGGRVHLVIAFGGALVAVASMRALAGGQIALIRAPGFADALMFLGVFVGLFALLTWRDNRVRTPHDIARIGRGDLLGIIPAVGGPTGETVRQILQERAGPAQEAFARLYNHVKLQSKNAWPKTIVVSSSRRGEGKTFVACNLAASCARHGRRTLLIDADLRSRSQRARLGRAHEIGLVPWFAESSRDAAAGIRSHIVSLGEKLDSLGAGGSLPRPADLLESAAFGELLARCKCDYDLVVINTPPMSVASDAVLVADHCDEVVYVCGFNRVTRRRADLFLRALHNGKNEILGIVLNGLPPRHMEYFASRRFYRSYKQHYGASD